MSAQVFSISGISTDYGWGPTQDGRGVVVWKDDWFQILGADAKLAFTNTTVDTAIYDTVQAYWAAGTPTDSGAPDIVQLAGKVADYGWARTQDDSGLVVWKGDWFQIYGLKTRLAFADITVDTAAYESFQAYWAAMAQAADTPDAAATSEPIAANDPGTASDVTRLAGQAADYGWGTAQDGKSMVVWKGDWFQVFAPGSTVAFDDGTVTVETNSKISVDIGGTNPRAGWTVDAADDAFTGEAGKPITGNILSNDAGFDAATGKIFIDAHPANGSLTIDALGNFAYVPNPGFTGEDSFSYTVQDDCGFNDAATVRLTATPPADPTGAIGDRVWVDDDQDGVQDDGEKGLAGVSVALRDAGGTVIATTTTDANGNYLFDKLPPGDYSVAVTPPEGYTVTGRDLGGDDGADSDIDAGTGRSGIITLKEGERNLSIDAGLCKPVEPPVPVLSSLGDYVWLDADKDGAQDSDEQGLANVTVKLLDRDGEVVATQQTDATGKYLFDQLQPGEYKVQFVAPEGYGFTKPDATAFDLDSDVDVITGTTYAFELFENEHLRTIDAGLVTVTAPPPATSSIGDYVWLDADKDGAQDGGEQGVPGVTVNLLDGDGKVVATQQTDATGKYLFENLQPGSYQVAFDAPEGYGFTAANTGAEDLDSDADLATGRSPVIELGENQHVRTVDAGLVTLVVNRPPAGVDDSAKIPCSDTDGVTIDVLANDGDADGDPLTATLATQPNNGTVTQNPDGTFAYKPNAGFYGEDVFTYTVSDGKGGTAEAKVTIDVDIKTVASFSSDDFRLAEGATKVLNVELNKAVTEDTTVTVKLVQTQAKLADDDVKLYTGHDFGTRQGTFYYGTQEEKDAALRESSAHHQLMRERYGLTDAALEAIPVGVDKAVQDFQLLDASGRVIDVAADGTFEVTVKAGQSVSEAFTVRTLHDMHLASAHDSRDYQETGEDFGLRIVSVEDAKCLQADEVTGTIVNEFIRHTPIALDLNGDGRIGVTGETSSYQKDPEAELGRTVAFDIDGDGNLDTTEWFAGDGDGILVDLGRIGATGEIDGKALFGDEGGKFANGYDKLKLADRDGDGMVAGEELDELGVWIDDGDARLEEGELKSAADAGIAAISTGMEIALDDQGRALMQSSAFDLNGQAILTEDVWFAAAPEDPAALQPDPIDHHQAA
jgi:protocatechuate 3,4-dioxygenase beta subunit